MTQLSILGPPRGGRRVKSEKEFLEESLSWSNPGNLAPVTPPAVIPSPVEVPGQGVIPVPSIVPAYFKVLGRFNVGGITKQGRDYIFHDLELPMGCWKELTLYGRVIPGNPQSFDDWSKVTASSQPIGVMPADIRYGLMAVCHFKRVSPNLKEVIAEIRSKVWFRDSRTNCPHNSTRIVYRANDSAVILPGVGWLQGHPFGVLYKANVAGPDSVINQAAVDADPSVQSALESLVGENNPTRCDRVLKWGIGLESAMVSRLGQNLAMERVVVIENVLAYNGIGVIGGYHPRPARAIRADKQNYIRK